MKAHKKTLMAVKAWLEEQMLEESSDRTEQIDEFVFDANALKSAEHPDIRVVADECVICWGDEEVAYLETFLEAYTSEIVKSLCRVLDSFVGEDLDDISDLEGTE